MCNINVHVWRDKLLSTLQSSVGASTVDNKRHKSQICICWWMIFVKQLNQTTNGSQIPQCQRTSAPKINYSLNLFTSGSRSTDDLPTEHLFYRLTFWHWWHFYLVTPGVCHRKTSVCTVHSAVSSLFELCCVSSESTNTHTHTLSIYIYIYIYVCACVWGGVCSNFFGILPAFDGNRSRGWRGGLLDA